MEAGGLIYSKATSRPGLQLTVNHTVGSRLPGVLD
jgi:hypothetical protein